jgi:outer membrane protein assembly factor BamB
MRRFLSVAAIAAVMCFTVRADDWPQWMGPKRDGVWRETGILDRFPEGGPKVRWRKPIGPGYSGPAIIGDRVYITERVTEKPLLKDGFAKTAMAGSERTSCLDLKTGALIWKHEYDCPYVKISYPTGPRTTPTVQDGKVWTLGTMGHLFCLEASTGKVIWSKNLKDEYKSDPPIWGHSAHLLVDGNKLITLAGGDGSAVVALEKDTGKEIWHALTSKEVCYCPPTIFEVGGKRQLIIWLSETLNGLDPESGKVLWTVPYPENGEPQRPAVNIPQPRLIGDLLFVSSFYHGPLAVKLGVLNANGESAPTVAYRGKTLPNPAKDPMLHLLMSTPAEADGYLYGTGATGDIECSEAATGKRIWSDSKPFGGKEALFGTIFFIRNGDRYFLFTDQGDLLIAKLSPKGYEELGRAHLLNPSQSARGREVVWSHPGFASKCMVARNDKEIICVELAKP